MAAPLSIQDVLGTSDELEGPGALGDPPRIDAGAPAVPAADPAAAAPAPAAEKPGPGPAPVPAEPAGDTPEDVETAADMQRRMRAMALANLAQQRKIDDLTRFAAPPPAAAAPPAPAAVEDKPPPIADRLTELNETITSLDRKLDNPGAGDDTAEIRRDLRKAERAYTQLQTQQVLEANKPVEQKPVDTAALVQEATTAAQLQIEYRNTLQDTVKAYPVLNEESDLFDPTRIDGVVEVYNPLVKGGWTPSRALMFAAKSVLGDPPAATALEAATAATAAPTTKEKAVERNVAAEQAQPPNLALVGGSNKPTDAGKFDFEAMSIDQVMQLSDQEMENYEQYLARHE